MEFSAHTIKIAKEYNLTERDVIFCHLIASGADRAEAYFCIYEHGTKSSIKTYTAAQTKCNDFFKLHPGAQILIQRIKNKKNILKADAMAEIKSAQQAEELEEEEKMNEEGKKFTDKFYIIKNLSLVAKSLTGKDKADVLMKIADLQRMKNEETKEKEEQRRFYLPYVSRCRGCKLANIVLNVLEKPDNQEEKP